MKTLINTLILLLIIFISVQHLNADEQESFRTEPTTNNGKKWRIAYYEGGPYIEYLQNFIPLVKGLMELGWIKKKDIPQQHGEETKPLWDWINKNLESDYIDFVQNGHYTANWDDQTRIKMSAELITRLNEKKDIDFMIAMGTWAAKDLSTDAHSVPTMAVAVSDALASGVIKSIEDSGLDHFHARVDPTRYERQVQIFHDIIRFKKLGVAYENTEDGRSYAAIDKVEKVAKESGFELVPCYILKDEAIADVKVAEERVKKCIDQLCQEVDAVYVTLHTGVNKNSLPEIVDMLNKYKVPSFSQAGSEEVKKGLLLSISQAEFKYVGLFHATIIAKVFNGAKPRQLDQLFEDPPKIAINLKTAELIGFDPPVDVLGAADEIFQEIEKSEPQKEE